jgi:UDPglucose 6-dehydrogenase
MPGQRREAITVVGLGKLGLPFACLLASRGFHVTGIDASQEACERVNSGHYDGHEPGVAQLLAAAGDRLRATADFGAASTSDLAFVIVPTPSDADDRFDAGHAQRAITDLTRSAIQANKPRSTIVLVSTVMPGTCANELRPLIERLTSGTKTAIDLVYSPEFIALGSVIRDLLHPDLILVGSDEPRAARRVSGFYRRLVENEPRTVCTNFINAELAKLAINTALTVKITLANHLAALCETLPGADVDEVTRAVGADSRIGPKYLRGGLGFGGPCLPRDVRAMSAVLRDQALDGEFFGAVSRFNRNWPQSIADLACRHLRGAGSRVAVVGLAYSAHSVLVEDSQALDIVRWLVARNIPVTLCDRSEVLERIPREISDRAQCIASLDEALASAELVVLATPSDAREDIPLDAFAGKTVIDCWRVLAPRLEFLERVDFDYIPLGAPARRRCPPPTTAASPITQKTAAPVEVV